MYTAFAIAMAIIVGATIVYGYITNLKKAESLNESKYDLIEKYWYILLALIVIVYFITRRYHVAQLPNGIHIDEIGGALDAKCIRDFGTDRNGIRLPAYFKNYGRGQSAMYIYTLSVLLRFLPCDMATLRLPAIIYGGISVVATFGIVKELTESKFAGLIGAVAVTITPVYIMSERWALDCYLLLPFCSFFMYFAIRAVKYEKIRDFVITGILMGAALYTYAVTFIVLPVMLVFIAIYMIIVKRFKWKQVLALAVPLFVLALPLILFNLVDLGIIQPFSTFLSDFVPLPNDDRGSEFALRNIVDNIGFLKILFLGGDGLIYNAFTNFGAVYLFMAFPIIAGLVMMVRDFIKSIKEKYFEPSALVLFFFISTFIYMMLCLKPNINRVNEIYMPFTVMMCICIFRVLKSHPWLLTIVGACAAASFAFFMYFYLFMQNDYLGNERMLLFFGSEPVETVNFVRDTYASDGRKVYIMIEDEVQMKEALVYYAAATSEEMYDPDVKIYGNVEYGFPEEFDENENAVYIIYQNWNHITGYLTEVGFGIDTRFPGYSILFK